MSQVDLRNGNVKLTYSYIFLGNNILKCEHNCQNDDVTNIFLNIYQQSRQDVLRNSMSIFTEKKFIYISTKLCT